MLKQLELGSDRALEELYAWHDGTATPPSVRLGDISLIPGFYLLSLKDACTNYRAFVEDPRWEVGWFPILADGGGDFYVVDLSHGDSAVVHFMIDQEQHPKVFLSVARMIETFAEAFDVGAFFIDPNGHLAMHDEQFALVARELNPGIAGWRP